MADQQGWISLHRKIMDHWLYDNRHTYSKFEAWIDILLSVNHEPANVAFGHEILVCGRGQSLYSLDTWAKRWRWEKSKVRRFLNTLKNRHMIATVNVHKTTLLTVCNYDTYQAEPTPERHPNRHSNRHPNDTRTTPNNNDNKNSIGNREEIFKKSLFVFVKSKDNPTGQYDAETVKSFYEHWSKHYGNKMRFELENNFNPELMLAASAKNNTGYEYDHHNQLSGN